MKFLNFLALLLIVVGALNWGLWGFFQYDAVADLFHGSTTFWARVVYSVVGLAGIWSLGFFTKCKAICGCKKGSGGGCSH